MKLVSVIIPTYNRINMLKNCLSSFEGLNYPKECFEVIVVDDGSTDRYYETLKEIIEQFTYKLRVIQQSNGGPAKARNNGIRNAGGEFIAVTDDDCEVDKNWLREIIKGFTSEEIAGVGGMVVSKNKDIFSQYMDYNKILLPRMEDNKVKYLVTANACYRRKCLLDVNGFSEEIKNPGGEDPDLSYKLKGLGYSLAFNPKGIVIHNHKQDLRSFYRTFFNYGKGSAFLRNKWGEVAGKNFAPAFPIAFYMLDLIYPLRRMLYLYKQRIGFYRSMMFAFLNHIARVATISGWKVGY